jgi:hypothetical protein
MFVPSLLSANFLEQEQKQRPAKKRMQLDPFSLGGNINRLRWRQVLSERKAEQVKLHNERMRDISQKKKKDTENKSEEQAARIAAILRHAEQKRTSEKHAVLERVRSKNQHVKNASVRRKSLDGAEKESINRETEARIQAAKAKRAAEALAKIEKSKALSKRVLEAQEKKAKAIELERQTIDRETGSKMAEANARRMQLLEERSASAAMDMAKVKGVQAMVLVRRQQAVHETEEKVQERLAAAEERHAAAIAETREKFGCKVRHAMEVAHKHHSMEFSAADSG